MKSCGLCYEGLSIVADALDGDEEIVGWEVGEDDGEDLRGWRSVGGVSVFGFVGRSSGWRL